MTNQRNVWKVNVDPHYFDKIQSGQQRVVFVPNTPLHRSIRKEDLLEICRQPELATVMTGKVKEIFWEASFHVLVERCSSNDWLEPGHVVADQVKDLEALYPMENEKHDGAFAISVQVTTVQEPPLEWSSLTHGWAIFFKQSEDTNQSPEEFYQERLNTIKHLINSLETSQQITISFENPQMNLITFTGEESVCHQLIEKIDSTKYCVVKNEAL